MDKTLSYNVSEIKSKNVFIVNNTKYSTPLPAGKTPMHTKLYLKKTKQNHTML